MNKIAKLITTLAIGAMSLTSCSLFGTEITKDEALEQLKSMETSLEEKYDGLDLDKGIPDDLAYLYVDASGYTIQNNNKIEQKGTYFFSMKEDEMYSIMKSETSANNAKVTEEEYIVKTGDEFTSWKVMDGVLGEIKNDSSAALGLVLVYAIMLASATPNYALEEIQDESVTAISFTKYSDTALDCCWEVNYGEDDESDYAKEVHTVSYKDNIAKSHKTEGYDANGEKISDTTMKFTFGQKKASKPTVPSIAA